MSKLKIPRQPKKLEVIFFLPVQINARFSIRKNEFFFTESFLLLFVSFPCILEHNDALIRRDALVCLVLFELFMKDGLFHKVNCTKFNLRLLNFKSLIRLG